MILDQQAQELLNYLKEQRRELKDEPLDSRRSALASSLSRRVSSMSSEQKQQALDGIRELLTEEARQRETDLEQSRRRVAELEEERDRLLARIEQLETAAPAETPGATPGVVTEAGSQPIREFLARWIAGESVKFESSGIPDADMRFLRLVRELLRFAVTMFDTREQLLQRFGVGAWGDFSTQLISERMVQYNERIQRCLQDQEGSVREFAAVLGEIKDSFFWLNESHLTAATKGCAALLEELDPEQIQQKHEGRFQTEWKNAFVELSSAVNDRRALGGHDLWERFFAEPLRLNLEQKLAQAE